MNYKKINKLTTLCLIAGIVIIGIVFRFSMNTDAVAYLRIAQYYADANFDLAISGYWGPLFSWLLVPFLKIGIPPLISARILMALSAIFFYFACDYFFKRSNLREEWGAAGRLTAGFASLIWSVQQITPDLLMAGLLTIGTAKIIPENRDENGYDWLITGLVFGLAFLAKPVAFPIVILMIGLFPAIIFVSERHKFFIALKDATKIAVVFLLISGVWITVLSCKYHKVTISTSSVIAHAIVGPNANGGLHPFSTGLQPPETGRITNWEDPSKLHYNYWSPISSLSNFLYQLKIIGRNTVIIIAMLFALHPVLFILAFGALRWFFKWGETSKTFLTALLFGALRWFFKWGETGYLNSMSWFRLILPVFVICLVYLPVWISIKDTRYFYPALPYVFSSIALFFSTRMESWKLKRPGLVRFLPLFLAIGTALPLIIPGVIQAHNSYRAGLCAHKIADGIIKNKIQGNIAGSGLIRGGRIGLFTSFLLNRPWYGDSVKPTPEQIKTSGASIFIASTGTDFETALKNFNESEDITNQISDSLQNYNIRVFKIRKSL